jgi:hypothetical protein
LTRSSDQRVEISEDRPSQREHPLRELVDLRAVAVAASRGDVNNFGYGGGGAAPA